MWCFISQASEGAAVNLARAMLRLIDGPVDAAMYKEVLAKVMDLLKHNVDNSWVRYVHYFTYVEHVITHMIVRHQYLK